MSKELVAGQKIQTYEIISLLGCGGMSRVYLCEDLVLSRRVALKQLLTADSDSRSVIRLQQEGQSLARLSHPNIVEILTFFNTEDGAPYLVMEVLHGCSLAELLGKNGSLSVGEVLKLAQQLCDALQHAHDQGIVHRDIKPSNIFLCNKKIETAKIIDFGIAKIADNSVNATRTGEFVGSPAYLSPEQALQKDITARSDQYSLGCVLYECLTGHPPFEDPTAMGLILKHVNDEVVPIGKNLFVPPVVAKAIERSLKKDPQDRFASMDEFVKALEGNAVATGSGKSKIPVLAAAFVMLTLVGVSIWALTMFLPVRNSSPATSGSVVAPTSSKPAPQGVSTYPTEVNDPSFLTFAGSPKLSAEKNDQRIILSLRRNPNLEDLKLDNSEITEYALKTLASAKNLKAIDLVDTNTKDNAGDYFAQIRTLQSLNVSRTSVGDAFFEKISTLPKLKHLWAAETKVTERGLKSLTNTPSLRELSIQSCRQIADSTGSVIRRMPWLRMLDVAKTGVGDTFIKNIGPHPKLYSISLSRTHVTQKCLALLGQMKSLRAIYLDNDGKMSDLSALKNLPLEFISLRDCDINENTVRQLSGFQKLELLRLDKTACNDGDLAVLARIPRLKSLQIADCALISAKGLAAFEKLRPDCTVKTVDDDLLSKYKKGESVIGAFEGDITVDPAR